MAKHVHEHSDINVRAIVIFTAGLSGFILASIVAMVLLFRVFEMQQEPGVSTKTVHAIPEPPDPRLQVSPARDLKEIVGRENRILSTYGWVDRDKGIVHIPIEKAMTFMLEKGYPVREE